MQLGNPNDTVSLTKKNIRGWISFLEYFSSSPSRNNFYTVLKEKQKASHL